jgi:Tfp pilus assembly protein PilO
MKKIIESFNKLNEQTRYGLLIFAVVVIILLDVLLLALPQMAAIGQANDKAKDLAANIQQVLTDSGRMALLKKNLETTRVQFNALSNKVRTTQEVPVILDTISSVANEYGVKIEELVPETDRLTALTRTPQSQYYALPVSIKARGAYHNFGRFINKLENSDLFFIMKDFIIQNDAADPHTHLYSLTINLVLADRGAAVPKSL